MVVTGEAFGILVGKPHEKHSLGRRWEDNIKMNCSCEYGKLMELIEDCVQWHVFVLVVLNCQVLLREVVCLMLGKRS